METKNIRHSQQESQTGNVASGATYGYVRVSTIAQHDDRQRIAMEEFGIPEDCLFADKQSGKDFSRPAYIDLMATIRPGDTVVVNINTPYLIQSQTKEQTSKVLAARAFEVFCCPADALFCQQARVVHQPPLYVGGANGCIF